MHLILGKTWDVFSSEKPYCNQSKRACAHNITYLCDISVLPVIVAVAVAQRSCNTTGAAVSVFRRRRRRRRPNAPRNGAATTNPWSPPKRARIQHCARTTAQGEYCGRRHCLTGGIIIQGGKNRNRTPEPEEGHLRRREGKGPVLS